MAKPWTLGGLSMQELLRRTVISTWRDSVFGQAGRMAFYHFLAIFPSLLLFLVLAGSAKSVGAAVTHTAEGLFSAILPGPAAGLVQRMVQQLQAQAPVGFEFLSACAGALWAAANGTWAIMYGLNVAYEVEECRNWKELTVTILGLTIVVEVGTGIAFLILFTATNVESRILHHSSLLAVHAAQWMVILFLLLLVFATLYRFGPNLKDAEWKWSTPGSLCALALWVACTVGLRIYFEHVNNYQKLYGDLNTVVMLLLWLYFSNASILIGGEMNSEIEKAADRTQKGQDRSGS